MVTKTLIIFSTFAEAEPTIKRLEAKAVADEEIFVCNEGLVPSTYAFAEGWIVISGWGIQAAQLAASKFPSQVDRIWNLGFAGSLRDHLGIGSIRQIDCVGKYIPLPGDLDEVSRDYVKKNSPILNVGQVGVRLISSEFPIHDVDLRKTLSEHWDLVDMEGYGIAYSAHHLKVPCTLWKIVSDFASPGGRQYIQKYRKDLALLLSELITERIYASQTKNESSHHTGLSRN